MRGRSATVCANSSPNATSPRSPPCGRTARHTSSRSGSPSTRRPASPASSPAMDRSKCATPNASARTDCRDGPPSARSTAGAGSPSRASPGSAGCRPTWPTPSAGTPAGTAHRGSTRSGWCSRSRSTGCSATPSQDAVPPSGGGRERGRGRHQDELHRKLRLAREGVLSKLVGLSEYDLRRPMTPTGTNLLGLVKHLAGVEYGYLGESFDRPPPEPLPWVEDGTIWEGADMWATSDEPSADIIALYRRACEHGDRTIEALDLTTPGTVAHWPPERRDT